MQQSGFDRVIETLVKPGKLVYAGYSAAVAVVAPSLRGVELVDDIHATAKGYDDKIIWDGYGLIDFYPIVHYQSDHPESELVEKELEHVKSMNIKYKTLRDGDVIIVCD
jgi:dipeptidase E